MGRDCTPTVNVNPRPAGDETTWGQADRSRVGKVDANQPRSKGRRACLPPVTPAGSACTCWLLLAGTGQYLGSPFCSALPLPRECAALSAPTATASNRRTCKSAISTRLVTPRMAPGRAALDYLQPSSLKIQHTFIF